MNVNLFKDNPEWWWFVIVSGVVLGLTILGWLCFKYGQVRENNSSSPFILEPI